MTFYQELQLNSAGSKELIRQAQDKKEKWRHILIYNFKVYLVVAFCFAVVTIYSMIFGSDNSVAGVVVLLALMVLRQVDFGIKTSHGVGVIFLIFGILAAGPRLSNMLSPVPAFCVNVICILGIMVLGCHNVLMSNQSTFVLAYLLLQGYDVTGHSYMTRITGLALGAAVCALVFHIRHRGRVYKRSFSHLFREFSLYSARTQWYIRLTLGVSSAMLIASLLHIPRVMWVGIASMSVLLPFAEDLKYRVRRRAPFNILGCAIGLIGGIGVGYSAGYSWQTVFNTFGALAIASDVFGLGAAILLRIAANVFASLYSLIFNSIIQRVQSWISGVSQGRSALNDVG